MTEAEVFEVRLSTADGAVGRGEACGVDYAGETPSSMAEQVESVTAHIEAGAVTRLDLLSLLPAGGARFALDAALWDLEAKRGLGDPFAVAGVAPAPVQSARTIGIRTMADYEAVARRYAGVPVLKIKVDGVQTIAAIEAVRRGAPDAQLIVDPNQAWSVEQLKALAPTMAAMGVVLLEQPIPVGAEAALDGYQSPVPLCADELIDDESSLAQAKGRFQVVNIKLDKSGGLTAALALADAAEAAGFGLMVGCMVGSSLNMAPAMVLAQRCAFVDLDSPLFLEEDHPGGFTYLNGAVERPHLPELWG
jgi:L-alanine-DL-glutamate epimerase-like enolase superfamily enzyme